MGATYCVDSSARRGESPSRPPSSITKAMTESPRPDLYISADIETDGPIPGPYSMLSFALCIASTFDGAMLVRREQDRDIFYCELAPIAEQFEQEALEVNGLDRGRLVRDGSPADEAMRAAAEWVDERANGHRPVLIAYPVAFDWSFLYWYFMRFAGKSPFGFSSCLDIRTLYQARALTVHGQSGKASMPARLLPSQVHTHHAADDAFEQAELFNNILVWALAGAKHQHESAAGHPPVPEWLQPLGAES